MELVIAMVVLGLAVAALALMLVVIWDKKNRVKHPDASRKMFEMNRAKK